MISSKYIEPWQLALPRRVATLARIGPLHRFEQDKSRRSVDFAAHDLRTLCLMVFDAVIERMGISSGASRDEIAQALDPLIVAGEPGADSYRVLELTNALLDLLLNEADRRRAFSDKIGVVENGKRIVRQVNFHYLQQVFAPDDEPLYRATVEGINLYTGTLGLDVEDAHAANAAVLKYQIGRGRFREAVATARQAVAITTGYEQKVRRALETARRDVSQVRWAEDILMTLAEVREHLRARVDADNEILAAVEEHQDGAEADEREHVADLIEHVRACQVRNAELHRLAMGANPAWLAEHARQSFRARAISLLPDLESSVLRGALALDDTRFDEDAAWQMLAAFFAPDAPAVADGGRLIEMLLAPPRDNEGSDEPLAQPEAEEMTQAPERFTGEDFADAYLLFAGLPDEGRLLSDVLGQARSSGRSETAQTLVYLLALQDFGEAEETAERFIDTTDRCFIADPFSGDDLLIRPAPAMIEEDA
jgi:hypothetical protein